MNNFQRKTRFTFTLCIVLVLAALGCSRCNVPPLFNTTTLKNLEVLQLVPYPKDAEPIDNDDPNRFHGWTVKKRVKVSSARQQTSLSQLLAQGISEGDVAGVAAACFEPRHGVIASYDDGTVELVICFTCEQAYIYRQGKGEHHLISSRPKELLDELLGIHPFQGSDFTATLCWVAQCLRHSMISAGAIPKGFRLSAQHCSDAATLGESME